jgi:hypothetical protein
VFLRAELDSLLLEGQPVSRMKCPTALISALFLTLYVELLFQLPN